MLRRPQRSSLADTHGGVANAKFSFSRNVLGFFMGDTGMRAFVLTPLPVCVVTDRETVDN